MSANASNLGVVVSVRSSVVDVRFNEHLPPIHSVLHAEDGVNRYWLWSHTSNTGSPTLDLLPEQILDVRVLGKVFEPAQITARPPQWSIPRDWSTPSGTGKEMCPAGPVQTEQQTAASEASQFVNN